MVNNDSIQHLDPELKELLFTHLKTTSNLCEFMNSSMTMLLNTIMSLQADEVCQAQYNERTDKHTNCRNGYRKRILTTSVGSLHLLIPKLRKGTYFPENIFSRWARIDRAVICAVAEMYVSGTSTRKVKKSTFLFCHKIGSTSGSIPIPLGEMSTNYSATLRCSITLLTSVIFFMSKLDKLFSGIPNSHSIPARHKHTVW